MRHIYLVCALVLVAFLQGLPRSDASESHEINAASPTVASSDSAVDEASHFAALHFAALCEVHGIHGDCNGTLGSHMNDKLHSSALHFAALYRKCSLNINVTSPCSSDYGASSSSSSDYDELHSAAVQFAALHFAALVGNESALHFATLDNQFAPNSAVLPNSSSNSAALVSETSDTQVAPPSQSGAAIGGSASIILIACLILSIVGSL